MRKNKTSTALAKMTFLKTFKSIRWLLTSLFFGPRRGAANCMKAPQMTAVTETCGLRKLENAASAMTWLSHRVQRLRVLQIHASSAWAKPAFTQRCRRPAKITNKPAHHKRQRRKRFTEQLAVDGVQCALSHKGSRCGGEAKCLFLYKR